MWCKVFHKQEVSEQTCRFCTIYCSKRKCDETKATNKVYSVDSIKPEDEAEEKYKPWTNPVDAVTWANQMQAEDIINDCLNK